MDTVNLLTGIFCIIGSLYWFAMIFKDGADFMERLAYLLAAAFVSETVMIAFGMVERVWS